MYVMLDEFHHRAARRADAARRSPTGSSRRFRTRSEDGLVNVFEAPPVEGLGTAGGFKIVVEDRGDLGSGDLQEVANQIVARGQRPTPRLAGPVHQLPGQHALALPRHRPRQGQADGRVDRRAVQHAAGLSRLAVRQRLQPLRPDLAGERAGRRRASASRSTTCKRLRVRNDRGGMVPLGSIAPGPRTSAGRS